MGMFDSVNFSCPSCISIIEVQSKAGECTLATFSSSDVPSRIAEDIDGEWAYCESCQKTFQVATAGTGRVTMGLIVT